MKTAGRVSDLAGVSVRTLRYYDKIGLLSPSSRSDTGYRLYSDGDLGRLQQILLFRESEFSLEVDAAVRAVRRDGEKRRRPSRAGSRIPHPSDESCSSTSTASKRSTTPKAITLATRSCASGRAGCPPSSARATCFARAETSSSSCCAASATTSSRSGRKTFSHASQKSGARSSRWASSGARSRIGCAL